MPTTSPPTQVYSAIWGLLEGGTAAATAYKAKVAVANRIKWTAEQPMRNPSRQPADVPAHEIRQTDLTREAAPAFRTFCPGGKRRGTLVLNHIVVVNGNALELLNYLINLIDACIEPAWPNLGLAAIVEGVDPIRWQTRREQRNKAEEDLNLMNAGGTLRLVGRGTQTIRLLYDPTVFI
jgi:hypothetical protein